MLSAPSREYPLEDDDESDDAEESLRVRIPFGAARSFATCAREVADAGVPSA